MKYLSKLLLISGLFLYACARQGQLSGGDKDTTPPGVDTLHSTPNYATRFRPKRVTLKFDEWITLSDAAAQVVVSPPLVKKPEVTLKGKTVVVKFDENEVFRDSTTYTVNFGTAVKDLHENNPAKDLRFVFSTGDFIDSLVQRGQVIDAFSGDAIENVAVMLYDDLRDSVTRKDRPYYFSRTDKAGQYEIRNVKAGRFKLVAVEDLDQNLRWDGENERIAFPDSLIAVVDSHSVKIKLRLFKNRSAFRLADKSAGSFGAVKLKFTANADTVRLRTDTAPAVRLLPERMQDSLTLWYDLDSSATWNLYAGSDTIVVKALSRGDFIKKHVLRFAADVPVAAAGKKFNQPAAAGPEPVKTMDVNPEKPAVFEFSYPVVSIDTSLWLLQRDTVRLYGWSLRSDSLSPRKWILTEKWTAGKSYRFEILPGGITDLWGTTNRDTLRRTLSIPSDKQLGGLTLTAKGLTPGKTYVLQLLNGANLLEERSFTATEKDKKVVFTKLIVGTYSARLVDDRNGNGRWDTGDYWTHRQPEPVVTKQLEALRALWEVEASISLETGTEEKKKKK